MAKIAGRSHSWHDPRSIETYCAEKAEKVVEYMDNLFMDLVIGIDDEIRLISGTIIDAQRRGVDKLTVLMRLNDMQVEVFRRAMERKQSDMNALIDEKTNLIALSNDRLELASKSPPLLPSEVIAQIFSSLYFIEGRSNQFAEDRRNARTTLQIFLDDNGTSDSWRRLIRREIPGIFAGAGGDDLRGPCMATGARELLGPHPRVLSADQSNELDTPLSGASTTILATVQGWPALEGRLQALCELPWHNLILSTDMVEPWDKKMGIMNSLVQNFGRNLANLDCLEVYPFKVYEYGFSNTTFPTWGPLEVGDFDNINQHGSQVAPKLRVARLPLTFIRDLRPILNNITELEIGIPCDSDHLAAGFYVFAEYLRPYATTLVRLKLLDSGRDSRWHHWNWANGEIALPFPDAKHQGHSLLFPRLKELALEDFVECILLDALSTLKCPSMSELSISVGQHNAEDGRLISASLLHEMHPSLRCIDICLSSERRNIELFEALMSPDVNGNWLLPKLEAIRFGPASYSISGFRMLKTVTKFVIARLGCNATMPIRSIDMLFSEPRPDTINSAYLSTLKLLVPEAKISMNDGFVVRTVTAIRHPQRFSFI